VQNTTADIVAVEKTSKAADGNIGQAFDNASPDTIGQDTKNLKQAMAQVGLSQNDDEKSDESMDMPDLFAPSTVVTPNATGADPNLLTKRSDIARKPGILDRVGGWFARKVQSAKKATRRLNNWIMKNVLKFAGKLNKSDADPASLPNALKEALPVLADAAATEQKTTVTAGNIQEEAVKIKAGVDVLAEREQGGD
jgi:hypothetical protein